MAATCCGSGPADQQRLALASPVGLSYIRPYVPAPEHYKCLSWSQVDTAMSLSGTSFELHGVSSRATRRTAWPRTCPLQPKGAGWPDGALRNVKVRAWHLGQTGRVRHTEWECRPRLFSQPAAGAVLNFRRIVQPGPQPCLEALPSRYLEWASFRSLIERSSMAAIPTPRSSLRGRLAEALGCRQPRCVLKIARGLLLQQQSQRSRHAPHRSGVAAKFGGYPRCANSLPGEPD